MQPGLIADRFITAVIVSIGLFHGITHAQHSASSQSDKKKNVDVEMLSAQVLVVDPEDQPIIGAIVSPEGVIADGDHAHWIGWPVERFGPILKATTNDRGIAVVPYPKYAIEKSETHTLYLSVTHSDFVGFKKNFAIEADEIEVELKRGFKIALSAIDEETNDPITRDLYAVMSGSSLGHWKQAKNGMLVSPTFAAKKRQFRVMQIVEGKPVLFSPNLVATGDRPRRLLRDVKLKPGTRVEGLIDPSIPRPITTGHVAAYVVRRNKMKPNDLEQKWVWGEKSLIKEDGSFVFESLPQGEVLQMIAICDGFVPKQPEKADVEKIFPSLVNRIKRTRTMPHLVSLEGDVVKIAIAMEKSTSIRFTVKKPNGKPLAGVEIEMWPNQEWFTYGTSVLGSVVPSAKSLVGHRDESFKYEYSSRFTATTNSEGIAVIKGLSPGRTESFSAVHADYQLPILDEQRNGSVELQRIEMNQSSIIMELKKDD